MSTIQNTTDLLNYLINQAEIRKDWFGFVQQRMTAVTLAHQIAVQHADKMNPQEIVDFSVKINECIYKTIINPKT